MSETPQTSSTGHELAERLARAEADLAMLRERQEHQARLATLGMLAAGVAHEINNILTPVLAYAQLAESHPHDMELKAKAIRKAASGVESATQIAHAMLGFAAVNNSGVVAGIEEAFQNAMECIGRRPESDRITLVTDFRSGGSVRMSPLALQQVFMNLVLNAWAILKGTGGEINVSSVERADGSTIIRVSDTGPGIPKEIAGRLFEPFVSTKTRNGRGGSREQGGSGLGLAICRHTIEAASGTIAATSSPGRGTTFTITLPSGQQQRSKAG